MKTQAKILIIDDDLDVLTTAQMFLKQLYTDVHTIQKTDFINKFVSEEEYDVILLDMNFRKGKIDGQDGIFWLKEILKIKPDAVIIMITAYGDVDLVVKTIKEGAFDFIQKPWRNEKLQATISSGLKLRTSNNQVKKLKEEQGALKQIVQPRSQILIGESSAMNKLREIINKVAETDANVLILGENGTGKDVVAQEIYKKSTRKNEIFLQVDLGSLSETLFETELFGHAKGAFTDAKNNKPGKFELANGGTLFLDEIGNLSLTMQAKLLSVLQRRVVSRVGSNKETPVDFRLICATNKPLHEMIQNNQFREDLLYRINVVEITIPPLRKHKSDIESLANYFFKQFQKKYNKPELKINSEFIQELKQYDWPGNIRELQHYIEKTIVLSKDNRINASDLMEKKHSISQQIPTNTFLLDDMEKHYIQKAIEKNNGNLTKTANDLGIARSALYRKIEKYGL